MPTAQPSSQPSAQPTGQYAHPLEGGSGNESLIAALQRDGRLTIHELAAELGVSRDLVSRRLKSLTEEHGVRIVAAMDPSFAGHHLLVHAMVDMTGPVQPVAQAIAAQPETVFVSTPSGPHPVVFESRHGNENELHELLANIRNIPSVKGVKVTTYVEILRGFFVSRNREEITLDDIDYDLISILQQDGRTSYRDLSKAVHLSPSAVRVRVERLINSGSIRISAIKAGGVSRDRFAVGIGVQASGDVTAIKDFLQLSPNVDFAVRAHGNFDFISTLIGSSPGVLLNTLEKLRAIPEVERVHSWTHFNIVKEDYTRALGHVLHNHSH